MNLNQKQIDYAESFMRSPENSDDDKKAFLSGLQQRGLSNWDLGSLIPKPVSLGGEPKAGSLGEHISKSWLGQEVQSFGEGAIQGMSAGLASSHEAKPFTVNLPFFGETSPSRVAGNVAGAFASPILTTAYGLGAAAYTEAVPPILGATGRVAAGAIGSGTVGAGLETIRELVSGEKVSPEKIASVAAMDLALGGIVGAVGEKTQFKAWLSKVPEKTRAEIEAVKAVPEVQAAAQKILEDPLFNPALKAAQRKATETDAARTSAQAQDPLFDPVYQEVLRKNKAIQDFPVPPKNEPFAESVLPGSGVDIGTIPSAVREATQIPTMPLLPETIPNLTPPSTRGMFETSSQIALFEKEALRKQKELASQALLKKADLEFYKADVNFLKTVREATRKGEPISKEVLDEWKKVLARMGGGEGLYPAEGVFPGSGVDIGTIPSAVREATQIPTGTEPINLSNVYRGDISQENAPAILEISKQLDLKSELALKKIAKKAKKK